MKPFLKLIPWYQAYKRDLPWRQTSDPYLIWLSEVILQQTRVEQGLPYYLKFANRYPTVKQLAKANDNEVMKLWQGLGYYNRAKNMLGTARAVVTLYKGVFPKSYEQLLTLKGIGPYTAAAIASFAFNEAQAVVDGNVNRVLARYFGIEEPINSNAGKNLFAQLANEVLNQKDPASHNQAMMELGAMVCKPTNPICNDCVLQPTCIAFTSGTVNQYPVKLKKQPPKVRYLHYLVVNHEGDTYVRQRKNERIWHNLYEPPCIETTAEDNVWLDPNANQIATNHRQIIASFKCKHQLTHQTIYATFWVIEVKRGYEFPLAGYDKIAINALHSLAVHRLFDKFLQLHTLHR